MAQITANETIKLKLCKPYIEKIEMISRHNSELNKKCDGDTSSELIGYVSKVVGYLASTKRLDLSDFFQAVEQRLYTVGLFCAMNCKMVDLYIRTIAVNRKAYNMAAMSVVDCILELLFSKLGDYFKPAKECNGQVDELAKRLADFEYKQMSRVQNQIMQRVGKVVQQLSKQIDNLRASIQSLMMEQRNLSATLRDMGKKIKRLESRIAKEARPAWLQQKAALESEVVKATENLARIERKVADQELEVIAKETKVKSADELEKSFAQLVNESNEQLGKKWDELYGKNGSYSQTMKELQVGLEQQIENMAGLLRSKIDRVKEIIAEMPIEWQAKLQTTADKFVNLTYDARIETNVNWLSEYGEATTQNLVGQANSVKTFKDKQEEAYKSQYAIVRAWNYVWDGLWSVVSSVGSAIGSVVYSIFDTVTCGIFSGVIAAGVTQVKLFIVYFCSFLMSIIASMVWMLECVAGRRSWLVRTSYISGDIQASGLAIAAQHGLEESKIGLSSEVADKLLEWLDPNNLPPADANGNTATGYVKGSVQQQISENIQYMGQQFKQASLSYNRAMFTTTNMKDEISQARLYDADMRAPAEKARDALTNNIQHNMQIYEHHMARTDEGFGEFFATVAYEDIWGGNWGEWSYPKIVNIIGWVANQLSILGMVGAALLALTGYGVPAAIALAFFASKVNTIGTFLRSGVAILGTLPCVVAFAKDTVAVQALFFDWAKNYNEMPEFTPTKYWNY